MRTVDIQAKKRLILDAACRVLVKRGFQEFVLDEVAQEAGVAKGTLFLYYKSKDDLFSSAFADLVDQLGASLDAVLASETAGLPLLTDAVRAILGHFDRNRDFLSQFAAGKFPACGTKSNSMLMGKYQDNTRRMTLILRKCAEGGLFKPKDFSFESLALLGLCRSAMLTQVIHGSRHPLEKEVNKIVEFFLHGIGGKK